MTLTNFEFRGNTAFGSEELRNLVTNFLHTPIGTAELEQVRRILTRHYVTNHFINSGVSVPDQTVSNQTLRFEVIEGKLSGVEVRGTKRLRRGYVRKRILTRTDPPLNLRDLADSLDVLQRNPNIKAISGNLQPVQDTNGTVVVGEAWLDVRVQEANPFRVDVLVNNYRPASIGAEMLELGVAHQNLTRNSDVIELRYGVLQRAEGGGVEFSGLDNVGLSYAIPVTVRDTTLKGFYDRRNYSVVEEPFNQFDIASQYQAGGIEVVQPIYRTARDDVSVGLRFERRHSASSLLGEPFPLVGGTPSSETEVSVLRFVGDWARTGARRAFAVRFTGSWGLDFWEATIAPQGRDGDFFSILGQAQYVQRLWSGAAAGSGVGLKGAELVLRSAFQWANDPLVAIEQFPLGGVYTVRGYRANALVRDTGVMASAELQLKLVDTRQVDFTLRPFFDFGAGWDVAFSSSAPDDISSLGVGATLTLWDRFETRLDWGYPFRDLSTGQDDLQDLGLYFQVSYKVF